jgi:hypothetical protein
MAVAGITDEGQRVLATTLRTFATLGLRCLLIEEGPRMLRSAKEAVVASELTSADPKTSDSVRDFILGTGETSTN